MLKKTILCLGLILLLNVIEAQEENVVPNGSFEEVDVETGLPVGWFGHQNGYGPYAVVSDATVRHSGLRSVKIVNAMYASSATVYCRGPFEPGWYHISWWARTPVGRSQVIQIWTGGGGYSGWHSVLPEWSQFHTYVHVKEIANSIEFTSRPAVPGQYWIDDVKVVKVAEKPEKPAKDLSPVRLIRDKRKAKALTLLFSPINLSYLTVHAEEMAGHGFDGHLISYMMNNHDEDIWAKDGNPRSRDERDRLFREAVACNEACKKYGVVSNFIKVAFYTSLPDWFDDQGWTATAERFGEAARFGSLTGFRGMAIDMEYIEPELYVGKVPLSPDRTPAEMTPDTVVAKTEQRGLEMMDRMLAQWPDMDFILLPEGNLLSSNLSIALLRGFLWTMIEHSNTQGLHLFTEQTYSPCSAQFLRDFPVSLHTLVEYMLPDDKLRGYWHDYCDIGLGLWPLGPNYSDTSAKFSPEQFEQQLALHRAYSGRYHWIYGHGRTWFRFDQEYVAKYRNRAVHDPPTRETLPLDENFEAYCKVLGKRLMADPKVMGEPVAHGWPEWTVWN